jgi:hypothetical protein
MASLASSGALRWATGAVLFSIDPTTLAYTEESYAALPSSDPDYPCKPDPLDNECTGFSFNAGSTGVLAADEEKIVYQASYDQAGGGFYWIGKYRYDSSTLPSGYGETPIYGEFNVNGNTVSFVEIRRTNLAVDDTGARVVSYQNGYMVYGTYPYWVAQPGLKTTDDVNGASDVRVNTNVVARYKSDMLIGTAIGANTRNYAYLAKVNNDGSVTVLDEIRFGSGKATQAIRVYQNIAYTVFSNRIEVLIIQDDNTLLRGDQCSKEARAMGGGVVLSSGNLYFTEWGGLSIRYLRSLRLTN